MRNVCLGLFLLLLILGSSGCYVDSQFVAGVDAGWHVIGPEYTAYVRADPKLTQVDKTTRLRTAQLMTELIEEAKKP